MQKTIKDLIYIQKQSKSKAISFLNFCVSDGKTTLVSRVVVSTLKGKKDVKPASLYFSAGSAFARCSDGEYRMRHTNMDEDVVIVASEKLTTVSEDWVEVPPQHIVLISHKTNVLIFKVEVNEHLRNAKMEMKKLKKSRKSSVEKESSVFSNTSSTPMSSVSNTASASYGLGKNVEDSRNAQIVTNIRSTDL